MIGNAELPEARTEEIQTQGTAQQDFTNSSMDPSELIESLLDNSQVPKNLQKQFWALFSKSSKLTFITWEDIRQLMWEFELLKLTVLESLPKSSYTEELEMALIQIKLEFFYNLRRSHGWQGKFNERILLSASTHATFSPHSEKVSEEPGFLDKLTRIFR